jgi:hypothetical protein
MNKQHPLLGGTFPSTTSDWFGAWHNNIAHKIICVAMMMISVAMMTVKVLVSSLTDDANRPIMTMIDPNNPFNIYESPILTTKMDPEMQTVHGSKTWMSPFAPLHLKQTRKQSTMGYDWFTKNQKKQWNLFNYTTALICFSLLRSLLHHGKKGKLSETLKAYNRLVDLFLGFWFQRQKYTSWYPVVVCQDSSL